jgi:hypothetical protein
MFRERRRPADSNEIKLLLKDANKVIDNAYKDLAQEPIDLNDQIVLPTDIALWKRVTTDLLVPIIPLAWIDLAVWDYKTNAMFLEGAADVFFVPTPS